MSIKAYSKITSAVSVDLTKRLFNNTLDFWEELQDLWIR